MRQPFVHEMFEEVVQRHPSRTALMSNDRSLTYAELDGWSNNIAHSLLERGATKGSFIHIVSESSFSVIGSMIAALKIGGVFVPMDPRQPEHRLRALAAQVPPNQVLTEAAIQAKVAPWFGDRVPLIPVDLESPNRTTSRRLPNGDSSSVANGAPAPALVSEPDDMCYIYFTSGSTGKPKAIAGRLKSIDHFVRWEISSFDVLPGTVVGQLTQPVFDAFLRDTFTPLCAGGTIRIPENRDIVLNPEQLGQWIEDAKIELLHSVPSLFRTLLNANLTSASLPDLRCVLLSGEPLLPSDVQKWMKIFDQRIRLVNLYGPTETTMVKLFHVVGTEDTSRGSIPVGKPIPGAEVLLLDEKGKPAAPGATGDIYIRTPYRTLGYYGNQELTDAVFVRNPLNDDPADVVYRTGDLGRFLADGSLEFLGRKDQQVKVRGIRVELDEIENTLLTTGLVREAAVTSREDGARNTYLCAYVVPSASAGVEQVRHAIAATLPEYMVPSFFLAMERLPRTSTGKIDRKSLPTPESAREQETNRLSVALSETQKKISQIFSGVLGIEQVGLDENFFHLGGHSLNAILVISRLRRTFQIDLPLRSLFETPTVAGLAQKIEVAKGGRAPELPLRKMGREGAVALSFAQQRLWFLDQLQPGNDAFNILAAVRIEGPLDRNILEQCLNEMVSRHEVLRTCFVMHEGQPRQQVLPAQSATLDVVDLGWVPISEQALEVEGLLREQARRPFNLEGGSLFRPQVIRLGAREHMLALNMHHIVSDDWSLNVLVRELAALYEARVKRQPSPLPAPPIQYADFALWQRQWLQGDVLENQLSYWRKQLADLPVLELPLDFPRPALQSTRGSRITRRVQGDLVRRVQQMSRSHDVTLFMSLLAVFEVLLLRYSGAEDLAVGTPVANRNREEIEGLIGFFVNTLVLRADLRGNPPFTELLIRVRDTALGAYAHPDLPFEKLVEELKPERQLSHTPLFQVMFALQNAPVPELQFADLTLTPVDTATHAVKYDVRMTAEEVSGEEAVLHVDYSTELFSAATIERMLEHFQNLLQSAVMNPQARLSELVMMGEGERRRILEEWNATRRDYRALPSVPEMFEAQANRTPQATALEFEQETLSYAELNRRANQLAHHLRGLGVGPEVRVALFLDRGLEMVVALLGVLKAGGTYVPLDPEYPAERLGFVAGDAQVSVLVTQSRLRGRLPEVKAEIVQIDTDWEHIASQGGENLTVRVEAGHAAYILYTSGSTGRPKGVVVTHGGLTNFLLAMNEVFGPDGAGKWIAVTSICFDISVLELFWTLAKGDHVVLHPGLTRAAARAENQLSGRGEGDESWDYSGKDLQCTPSFATGLMEQWKTQPRKPRLRKVLIGGEAATESLVRDLMSVAEDGVYNMYGPTETTVWSSVHQVTTVTGAVPIGKPIANTQMYVLDGRMEPVPAGVPGELYIGGAGLARGYWQRSELTAERFVPNPFSATAGDRLYRTGDRVKWRPDGALDFLGRFDSQIKLRGFRIELGEIEGAIAQHPLVKEAAVLIREYNNDKSLAAYVVCASEVTIMGSALRQYLRDRLPEYMVPGIVVLLERMPLTPNGKLDRKALLAVESKATLDANVSAASGSELEQKIAAIWQDILHIPKVHLDDNFFDLGGHSLLVVQVWSRLRGLVEKEPALIDLFTYPSIRSLARYLDQNQQAADESSVPDRVRRRKEYFSRKRKNLQRETIQ
jgi:amino acid adenylation domain-containing protein